MKPSAVIRAVHAHLDANPAHSNMPGTGGYWFCNYLRNEGLTTGIGTFGERDWAAYYVVNAITEAMNGDTNSNTFADLFVHKRWGTEDDARDRTKGSPYYARRKVWLLSLAAQLEAEDL